MKRDIVLLTLRYPGIGGIQRSFEILEHYLANEGFNVRIFALESDENRGLETVLKMKYGWLDNLLLIEPLKTFFTMSREAINNKEFFSNNILLVRHLPMSFALSRLNIGHIYLPPCVSESFYQGLLTSVKRNERGVYKLLKIAKWNIVRVIYNYFERSVVNNNTVSIFTFSKNVKENLSNSTVSDSDIKVVPPGIDERHFFSLDKAAILKLRAGFEIDLDTFVVLYVGRISAGKNVDVLLDSFRKLDVRKKQMIVVGSGHYDFELQENVRFVGKKSIAELHQLYNVSNVTVLPTFSEGFGQVLIESLGCGTPVIGFTTPNNAINEIVCDDLFGLKTKTLTPDGLVSLLAEFYAKREYYDENRQEIEHKSKSMFSWHRFIYKVFENESG